MHYLARVTLLIAMTLLMSGCGEHDESVQQPPVPPTEALRRDLQYIVEHKTVGSEIMTIQSSIEKLKETDPAKAEKLLAEYEKLDKSTGGQAAVQAKKMLEML
ncbi:hypothetical protein LOC68_19480 [Blastopirellula sp. JC732]|uniref:Uncharacterized protein n=1 Tax=Blastopirellula sediminis TaxID=2894196 RepID=A0A9X1SHW9_9BACT|nr:hypothetical protein [Blastopirellula sediminis]MCC9606119.1 hypothetical protein [Blastopirellula sediminis]MCC9630582.1 hypothetical protein [Blastopirellula sediminis]